MNKILITILLIASTLLAQNKDTLHVSWSGFDATDPPDSLKLFVKLGSAASDTTDYDTMFVYTDTSSVSDIGISWDIAQDTTAYVYGTLSDYTYFWGRPFIASTWGAVGDSFALSTSNWITTVASMNRDVTTMDSTGSGGSGDDYSDIVFFWTCESTTLGSDDYSVGDTEATLRSAAAINTDAVKIGTNGLDCPTGEDYAEFSISSNDLFPADSGRIGFYFYLNGWTNSTYLWMLDGTADTYMYIASDDGISVYWNDGTNQYYMGAWDAGLTTGTWYFAEFAYDIVNDEQDILIDGVSVISPSNTIIPYSPSLFKFGQANGTSSDVYIDNIIISNKYSRDLNALKDLTASPR